MRMTSPLPFMFAGALAASACAGSPTARSTSSSTSTSTAAVSASAAVGQPLPPLELHDLDGKAWPLQSLHGRVVLLDVWASWCGPCREELPLLDEIAGRVQGRGIDIVAVSIDEDRGAAEELLRARPSWRLRVAHDPEGRLPKALRPPKMPSSYVIDRNGVLRRVHAGFAREDAARLEAELIELSEGG
jgi:cytochrome c biogenesis protein CcmG/thiol:disulfide interchange protein DsbE